MGNTCKSPPPTRAVAREEYATVKGDARLPLHVRPEWRGGTVVWYMNHDRAVWMLGVRLNTVVHDVLARGYLQLVAWTSMRPVNHEFMPSEPVMEIGHQSLRVGNTLNWCADNTLSMNQYNNWVDIGVTDAMMRAAGKVEEGEGEDPGPDTVTGPFVAEVDADVLAGIKMYADHCVQRKRVYMPRADEQVEVWINILWLNKARNMSCARGGWVRGTLRQRPATADGTPSRGFNLEVHPAFDVAGMVWHNKMRSRTLELPHEAIIIVRGYAVPHVPAGLVPAATLAVSAPPKANGTGGGAVSAPLLRVGDIVLFNKMSATVLHVCEGGTHLILNSFPACTDHIRVVARRVPVHAVKLLKYA